MNILVDPTSMTPEGCRMRWRGHVPKSIHNIGEPVDMGRFVDSIRRESYDEVVFIAIRTKSEIELVWVVE